MATVELVCIYCNSTYKKMLGEYNKSIKNGVKKHFCNRSCQLDYYNKVLIPEQKEKLKINKICKICKKEYKVNLSRKSSTLCSKECRSVSKRNQVKIECDYCGSDFYKIPSLIYKNNCCSMDCKNKLHADRMTGDKNPSWAGGIQNEKYPKEFNDSFKKRIKKRDDNLCQMCGKDRILIVHHIDYVKSNCNEHNLITLCSSCNAKANYNRDKWTKFYRRMMVQKYGV